MFDFFDNLCGCFSPEVKRGIIDYLSSANLNRNLMEEEKTNEEINAPEDSIYRQAKGKSYYFMKLQEDEKEEMGEKQIKDAFSKPPQSPEEQSQQDQNQPNYYSPGDYDQIYRNKLAVLQTILRQEIGPQFSKVYDSQDASNLRIFCKPEIYMNRRFNAYRFSFRIPSQPTPVKPTHYLHLPIPSQNINPHEPLLSGFEKVDASDQGVEVYHRKYKKVLVIGQHEFYTAEKTEVVEEEGCEVGYHTCFSVKGEWKKVADHSRGWVNLAGLRLVAKKEQSKPSNSLSQEEEEQFLQIEGYINCQLEISVNANMLKQPIAKQIRVYVQKLTASLTQSDA